MATKNEADTNPGELERFNGWVRAYLHVGACFVFSYWMGINPVVGTFLLIVVPAFALLIYFCVSLLIPGSGPLMLVGATVMWLMVCNGRWGAWLAPAAWVIGLSFKLYWYLKGPSSDSEPHINYGPYPLANGRRRDCDRDQQKDEWEAWLDSQTD